MLAILIRHLIIILITNSEMPNDVGVKQIFVCFLAISIASMMLILNSFTHLFIKLFIILSVVNNTFFF